MVRLLIMRHGPAGDPADWARSGELDSERPLTREGIQKTLLAAKGIHRLIETIDIFATSPWLRAKQTCEIVAKQYDTASITVLPELVPSVPFPQLLKKLNSAKPPISSANSLHTVAIFGHEPHLSGFMQMLVADSSGRFQSAGGQGVFELKKAGAALIEFEKHVESAKGKIIFLLQPKVLRKIGSL